MTIKALTFIHELLIEAENVALDAKNDARIALNEAELDESPDLDRFKKEYQEAREYWCEAIRARTEFEEHEFR